MKIFSKRILRIWIIGVVCSTIVAALVYAMMPPERDHLFQQTIAWFLWPGVALWVQMNGSLLFGSGFGSIGDFLAIAVGSALAWSIPIPFVVRGISWLRRRQGKPR